MHRLMKAASLIVAAALASTAFAAPTANYGGNPASATVKATLDPLIINFMQAANVPGLATVVVHDGQVRWMQTYGVLDKTVSETLASNKVAIDTPFRVASVSKAVTATIIMKLAEASLLPNEYADYYLPSDMPVVNPAYSTSRIALVHLLTHTSSIADPRTPFFPPPNISDATVSSVVASANAGTLTYTDQRVIDWTGNPGSAGSVGVGDSRYFYFGSPPADTPLTLEQYLRRILVPGGADYPVPSFSPNRSYFPYAPGAGYQYCNVNTALLGFVAERVFAMNGSPLTFAQIADGVVFQPLGMTRSSFSLNSTSSSILAATAVPHDVADAAVSRKAFVNSVAVQLGKSKPYADAEATSTNYQPVGQYGVAERPAKGLRTSIQDLGKFVSMLAAGGQVNGSAYLATSTVNTMSSAVYSYTDSSGSHPVGLGLFKLQPDGPAAVTGDNLWGHNGEDAGVSACMLFSKSTGYGMAIIMNGPADRTEWSCRVIKDIYATVYQDEHP
jgi:CubicO group peptidase (beta-lactamase class C family)